MHQWTQSIFNAWPLEADAESVKQSEASIPIDAGGEAAKEVTTAEPAQVRPPQSSHEACDDVQNEPAPAL